MLDRDITHANRQQAAPLLDRDLTVVQRQELNYDMLLASLTLAGVGLAAVYAYTNLFDEIFNKYFAHSVADMLLARAAYCIVLTIVLLLLVYLMSGHIKSVAQISQWF